MSESDFYTVNHRYEAQGAPREWPTWELQAHGSAAPARTPAAPDEPAGPTAPRLDPLGPWCSARLTFADGARIDVLVTVSDDHITVEDVRADPPLTLDGLADLGRWIEGPLDDAFRAATGRPRKHRPTPRQPGPAAGSPERMVRPAGAPASGPAPSAPAGPPREPSAGPAPGPAAAVEDASATGPTAGVADPAPTGRTAGVPDTALTDRASERPSEGPAAPTEPTTGPARGTGGTARITEPPEPLAEQSADAAAEAVGGTETAGPEGDERARTEAEGRAETEEPAAEATGKVATQGDGAEARTRPAPLARKRVAERRKLAADAYRQAQREGRDPVLAVMLATGRNRRRSLRLIAGARDEGLLTPRHNKR
ncbi:hypothetical protein HEK616_42870 [Streptomyces nigrescens]|uniref:Uncharacterized protein n=1 Tax=Streptomyces nigrescens TaxID=1920 RepID=A0ABM7ZWR6_STRNI|nr:hypothetical protein HEK616_42870 [Streptomyces nigrescens]